MSKEIESWKTGFALALRQEDRQLFMKMIEDFNKYTAVINAKGDRVVVYGLNPTTSEND